MRTLIQVNFEALLIDAKFKHYGAKYHFKNNIEIFSQSTYRKYYFGYDVIRMEIKTSIEASQNIVSVLSAVQHLLFGILCRLGNSIFEMSSV